MDDLTHLSPTARNAYNSMAQATPRFRRPNPVKRAFVLLTLGLAYSASLLLIGYALRGWAPL